MRPAAKPVVSCETIADLIVRCMENDDGYVFVFSDIIVLTRGSSFALLVILKQERLSPERSLSICVCLSLSLFCLKSGQRTTMQSCDDYDKWRNATHSIDWSPALFSASKVYTQHGRSWRGTVLPFVLGKEIKGVARSLRLNQPQFQSGTPSSARRPVFFFRFASPRFVTSAA